MSKSRVLPIVSAISLGIGGLVGSTIQKYRGENSFITEESINRKYYIPLPLVSASAAPTSNLPAVAQEASPTASVSGGNRISEIMRHGFPSLDNVRSFDNFVLAYDKRNRTAHWVFEHLTKDKVKKGDGVDREGSKFIPDDSIHEYFRSTNEDYKGSGYDRGHLAAAGNHKYSQKSMDQTFHLSNISPQVGKGFNRDSWNTLEKFVRHLTNKYMNVYVCTGPLYLPRKEPDGKLYIKYEVIGKNNVAVPTHFFKVVVCETESGQKELLSFVMPNQVLPDNVDLKNYLVPIDTIERGAGILLFDKIPKKTFSKINGKSASWF